MDITECKLPARLYTRDKSPTALKINMFPTVSEITQAWI